MNIPLAIGLVCLAVALWHEHTWFQRKNWSRVEGKVIDVEERRKKGAITFSPVISYMASGEESQFTSNYASSIKPEVPSTVTVMVSPDEKKVEQYSFSNRWMFTLIPLVMAVLLIIKGVFLS